MEWTSGIEGKEKGEAGCCKRSRFGVSHAVALSAWRTFSTFFGHLPDHFFNCYSMNPFGCIDFACRFIFETLF